MTQRTQHRVGLLVDAEAGAGREVPVERIDELMDPVVEVGEQRSVHMVGRELRRHPVEERGVEVRRALARDDHRDGPEQAGLPGVLARGIRAGRVGDAGRSEHDEAVDALGLELVLNLGEPLGAQSFHVGQRRNRSPPDRRSC